ncbi:helix-turn-helix transcriptional regulator [Patulibacter sp. NPDC049589]|uniref:helix-turn-helix transcriptional regulator n=1 Tax=Patulibacter sp. NPDC049589 TaxID=3154731 RepID=UPI00343BAE30
MTVLDPTVDQGTRRLSEMVAEIMDLETRISALGARDRAWSIDRPTSAESASRAARLLIERALRAVDDAPAGTPQAGALIGLSGRLHRLVDDLADLERHLGQRRVAQTIQTLRRLYRVSSASELLETVCVLAVESLGFSRAALFRGRAGQWEHWVSHGYRPGTAPERPDVDRPGTSSATIVLDGQALGLLTADRRLRGGGGDAPALSAFAVGVGHTVALITANERLRLQREHLRRFAVDSAAAAAVPADQPLEFSRAGHEPDEPPASTGCSDVGALTLRQRQIMDLVVQGGSNASIARELGLTEGTIKSHVKNILRCLRARNRTEAIGIYLAYDGPDER